MIIFYLWNLIEKPNFVKMHIKRVVLFCVIFLFFLFSVEGRERSFRTLGPLQGMTQASAISIWQDKWGRMWIGNEVLNCYSGDNITVYRLSEYFSDIEDADIHGICGNDSVLYFLAEEQLLYLDLITNELHRPGINAYAIFCDADNFYYSVDDELYTFDIQTNQSELCFKFPDQTTITSILSADNEIWLGATTGLYKLGKLGNDFHPINKVMHSESINSLYLDSRGRIWVSSRSQKAFIVSQEGQVIPLCYENGDTYYGEIFCFTESQSTGNIWMGTMAGIHIISMNDFRVDPTPLLPTSMIYALYTDRQETIWIGSYYGAVRYFNPQTDNYNFWKTDEGRYDRLHGVVLGSMAEDKYGNIYIATEGSGINVIEKNKEIIRHIQSVSSQLPNDKVRALWFDNEYNRMFISCYMEGLSYLDMHTGKINRIKSDVLIAG